MHASERLRFVSYLNMSRMVLLAIKFISMNNSSIKRTGSYEFGNQSRYVEIDSYGDIVSTVQYVAIPEPMQMKKLKANPIPLSTSMG